MELICCWNGYWFLHDVLLVIWINGFGSSNFPSFLGDFDSIWYIQTLFMWVRRTTMIFETEEYSYRAFINNMIGVSTTAKQAMFFAVGIPRLVKVEMTGTELLYWLNGTIAPIYFEEWYTNQRMWPKQ